MQIIKRNGAKEKFDENKIKIAIKKSFASECDKCTADELLSLTKSVCAKIDNPDVIDVESVQDKVEETLMEKGFYKVAKSYILYREYRTKLRRMRQSVEEKFSDAKLISKTLEGIQKDFSDDTYSIDKLGTKFSLYLKSELSDSDKLKLLVRAAVELTTADSPRWEYIAGRLYLVEINSKIKAFEKNNAIKSYFDKISILTNMGLFGDYIIANYTRDEIEKAKGFIDNTRDKLFNYSAAELLCKRYIILSHDKEPLESIQEMYLGIALHLAMKEKKDRMEKVKAFYDCLSTLKVTMATPTLANARKPFFQLSSCFIDTVPDSLNGIYRSIDNFAKVSKFGGGMGLYFGKVRAKGSSIRGFKGVSGGIIRWVRLANDTAVAVDQLGVRQGSVACYLDVWHKDLPEFLQIRTNNGDDRLKAHDVFPAICYPDLFWKTARDNINAPWYLMCPHDIKENMGYCLEDFWGDEWEKKYLECIANEKIEKRVIPIKDIIRLIIKSNVETGTPFLFNRDTVNRANPNSHKGIIYCSNLCTEIAQNMAEIQDISSEIVDENGDTIVVTKTRPGEFVVCNLASLSLGIIDTKNEKELEESVSTAVRMLDNVIDLNYFPLPYAKINNMKYRPIGLGVSGYHHLLAKSKVRWESDEHIRFSDELFEKINYYALKASCELAREKGKYEYFKGSEYDTGEYFKKRRYDTPEWKELIKSIKKNGLRNGYIMAIAPTSSTSIIAGTTPGVDPIMKKYFLEEKRNGLVPRVAPDLNKDTFWFYKDAHLLDQQFSVRACGTKQRHVDQAISMNLYITNDYSFRQILNLYILAFECGVKTIYYTRSKSLEIEECISCAT